MIVEWYIIAWQNMCSLSYGMDKTKLAIYIFEAF